MRGSLALAEAAAAAAFASILLGACASRVGTVVLLPEKDGRDASIAVRAGETSVVLAEPYAAADVTTAGATAYRSSAAEVQALFGAALAAQSPRPTQFTLYFVEGVDALTDESRTVLENALAELAQRPVPDIVIVGHTDSVGTDAFNDALALKRAEAVRALLLGRGLAPGSVEAVGRGKRQLAIPTADGVAEPRNRRVEIIVR